MTELEFEKIVKNQLDNINSLLVVKGKEYRRNNNPYHNFDEVAKRRGITSLEALTGMYMKHEQSFHDIVNDFNAGKVPTIEKLEEKITDIIIYMILAKGIVIREIIKQNKEDIRIELGK